MTFSLFFFFVQYGKTQNLTHEIGNPVTHYTAHNTGDNGLSHFAVNKIFQDSQDRLYALTSKGIDVKDGNNWYHWETTDILGRRLIPNDIVEDNRGHIWVATGLYLLEFDSHLNLIDTLKSGSIILEIDAEGNLWKNNLGGRGAAIVSPPEKRVVSVIDSGFSSGRIMASHSDSKGRVWLAIDHTGDSLSSGILSYNIYEDTYEIFTPENSTLPYSDISVITEDDEGNIIVGFTSFSNLNVTGGVARYDGNRWSYLSSNHTTLGKIQSLTVDHNFIYAGTRDTLRVYNGIDWEVYEGKGGVPLLDVKDILNNKNGELMVAVSGTDPYGLHIKCDNQWKIFSPFSDGGLPSDFILAIAEDNNGHLWTSFNRGISNYDGGKWLRYNESDGLISNMHITNIYAASDNTIWIGSQFSRLTYFKEGKFDVIDGYGVFDGKFIEDSKGNLWFTNSLQNGILKYNGNEFEHFTSGNSPVTEQIKTIEEGPEGVIYVSQLNNMIKYKNGVWSNFDIDLDGYIGAVPRSMSKDINGNLIMAFRANLLKWDGNNWSKIKITPEPSYTANDISVASDGSIWLVIYDKIYIYKEGRWQNRSIDGIGRSILHGNNGITYISTLGNGIYSFDRTTITSIEENNEQQRKIKIISNYPNPFNPTTNIRFRLPEPTDVQIDIFNSIGQKVSTLIDRRMNTGTHSVTFDANGLPSGVYIYQLKANGISTSKKMMLVK